MRLQQEREFDDAYQILRSSCRGSPTRLSTASKMVFAELADQILWRRPLTQETLSTLDSEEIDRSGYIDGLYR